MKGKIPSIFGLLAVLMLVVSLVPMADTKPAQAAVYGAFPNLWVAINVPSATGQVVVGNSEVSRLAVASDNKTIYALNSTAAQNQVWKSTDGGWTFSNLQPVATWPAGTVFPATEITVAPDDSNIVAIATNGGTWVNLSVDGGANWTNTGLPGLTGAAIITSIDISPLYAGAREIAVCSANPGAAVQGDLYIMALGPPYFGWSQQRPANTDIFVAKYSPRFAADKILLCIDAAAGANNGPRLNAGVRLANVPTTNWNQPSTHPLYPVNLGTAAAPPPGSQAGMTASMTLPFDYFGADTSLRRVYASYQDGTSAGFPDVYRLDDNVAYRLNCNAGDPVRISSLAYYGTYDSGKLLVGLVVGTAIGPGGVGFQVQVRRTWDVTIATGTWYAARKQPTGTGWAQVAWSPDGKTAYCGTGNNAVAAANDESAFSWSKDDGACWNQPSLVDTAMSTLADVEAANDETTALLASTNQAVANACDSVWRSTTKPGALCQYWERVLTRETANVHNISLVMDPDFPKTQACWWMSTTAATATQELFQSVNAGEVWVSGGTPSIAVADICAGDKYVLYSISAAGFVTKSTDGGWTWGVAVDTTMGAGYSINCARTSVTLANSKDVVLAGGTGGGTWDMAWSEDGAKTWTNIPVNPAVRGNTLMVANADWGKPTKWFYIAVAAATGRLIRWQPRYGPLLENQGVNRQFTGVVMSSNNVCYATPLLTPAAAFATGADRALDPLRPTPPTWTNEANGIAAAAVMNVSPKALKISGCVAPDTSPAMLWAIDSIGWVLYCYMDSTTKAGPTVAVPKPDIVIPCDPVTGRVNEFTITWAILALGMTYQVEIHENAECTQLIWSNPAPPAVPPAAAWAPPDPQSPAMIIPAGVLVAGKDYWLRIRAHSGVGGSTAYSQWSTPIHIKTEVGLPVVAPFQGPQPLSPANSAIGVSQQPGLSWSPMPGTSTAAEYELVLATDAALANKVAGTPVKVKTTAWLVPAKLDFGKTYFWSVRATTPAGDWSPVVNFTVKEAPPPPPVPPSPPPKPVTPAWVWAIIGIGALLVIVTLILIVKTRRA